MTPAAFVRSAADLGITLDRAPRDLRRVLQELRALVVASPRTSDRRFFNQLAIVSSGAVGGRQVIRLVTLNPEHGERDVDRPFDAVQRVATGAPESNNRAPGT